MSKNDLQHRIVINQIKALDLQVEELESLLPDGYSKYYKTDVENLQAEMSHVLKCFKQLGDDLHAALLRIETLEKEAGT